MNTKPDLTLCTYTYNDGRLARELLQHAAAWPLRPRKVIVMDDGSLPPFTLTENTEPGKEGSKTFADAFELGVEIIHLPENAGPGVCKARGLSAAKSEYILSLDCDIRLVNDWLPAALTMLEQPGVGLVGGAVVSDAGKDTVSRYLREVDHHLRPEGETDFVSGAAWLMPRAVWEATGGFGDYTARTHEDHYFCNRVRGCGYKVMACTVSALLQTRILSRADMLRRFKAWLESALREQAAPYDTIQAPAFQVCRESLNRLTYLLQASKGDVGFIYLETLLCFYTLNYMCTFKNNEASLGSAQGLRLAVWELLTDLPEVRKNLARDLAWPEEAPLPGEGEALRQAASWCQFWFMLFEPLRGLFKSELGRALEERGIAALEAESAALRTDYSFYKDL